MTIFQPVNADGYEFCHPSNTEDFLKIPDLIDGTRRAPTWIPLSVRLIRKDHRGRHLKESDSPWIGSDTLILRERAVAALRPMLLAHGELLPLSCSDATLLMLNVTRVLPAIDEAASGVRYGKSGGIRWVDRYVFREDVIAGSDIFRMTKLRGGPVLVTQQFIDLWQSSGLRGLEFKPALGTFRFS